MNLTAGENEHISSWMTPRRAGVCHLLIYCGLSSETIFQTLLCLKTEKQLLQMGRSILNYHEKSGVFPEHDQVMEMLASTATESL